MYLVASVYLIGWLSSAEVVMGALAHTFFAYPVKNPKHFIKKIIGLNVLIICVEYLIIIYN